MLMAQVDEWRKLLVWVLFHRIFPIVSSAWFSYFQLCFCPVCLVRTQMFNLRIVSSCFSAHIGVVSPLATTWLILGDGNQLEYHHKKNVFRTVNIAEASLTGPCT